MRPLLGNPTFFKHYDAIRLREGGKTLRAKNYGGALCLSSLIAEFLAKSADDACLGFDIDR